MKMNKWTLGLAAAGLVSLTPSLLAQTNMSASAMPMPVPVTTALSATTISGYVDTSMVWNPGTGNANVAPYSFNAGKQDGFNVDSVDLKVSKAEDEGQWAAGYTLELMYGPDAPFITGGTPLRQAYVVVRTPVGNGIDWQIGRWDNLLGYESSDSYKNPNWTRSYAYTIEPTEHTGVLASYKFCDAVTLQAGVANEVTTVGINARNASGAGGATIESKKGLVSLLTLTAPDSWGSMAKSTLYAGLDYGAGYAAEVGGTHAVDKTHVYLGATLYTPVKDLTLGLSWDTVNNYDGGPGPEGYATAYDAYISYKITDKLTLNGRGEYFHTTAAGFTPLDPFLPNGAPQDEKILAFTGTLQYDLWANVISRLEVRWDTSANGYPQFGGTTPGLPTKNNEILVAANIIYKF